MAKRTRLAASPSASFKADKLRSGSCASFVSTSRNSWLAGSKGQIRNLSPSKTCAWQGEADEGGICVKPCPPIPRAKRANAAIAPHRDKKGPALACMRGKLEPGPGAQQTPEAALFAACFGG